MPVAGSVQKLPIILVGWLASYGMAQCPQNWIPGTPLSSVNGPVNAIVSIPSSSNLNVIIGGEFTVAGDRSVRNLASWDGQNWSPVGGGLNGRVHVLAYHNGLLWVGGDFSEAGGVRTSRIATWNGESWRGLSQSIDGNISAISPDDGGAFVGGSFTQIDGQLIRAIARYDANGWHPVGDAFQGSVAVRTILPVGEDQLYIGGSFLRSGETILNRVARLEANSWHPMGAGFNQGEVRRLTVWNNQLVAGGTIQTTGNPPVWVEGVATWDGSSWQPMNSIFDSNVSHLMVRGESLFASSPSDPFVEYVDGSWIVPNAIGPGWTVFCDADVNGQFWVGGQFQTAGRSRARYVARFPGSQWVSVPFGTDGVIRSFCVYQNSLYAGGSFTVIDGVRADRVARWTGNSWERVGSGINADVTRLVVFEDQLYAAGWFQLNEGAPSNCIVRWDGSSWRGLGLGLFGPNGSSMVFDMVEHDGELYVSGTFERANGVYSPKIARWNGESWSNLTNLQITGDVTALCSWNGSLYLGGHSAISQGDYFNGVAKYLPDTRRFERVGFGIAGSIGSLVATDTGLVAAGQFDLVDGVPSTNHVVRWDGADWSDVGQIEPVGGAAFLNGRLFAFSDFRGLLQFENGTWSNVPTAESWSLDPWTVAEFGGQLWMGGAISRPYSPFVSGYARLGPSLGRIDLNQDQVVDVRDVSLLLRQFGEVNVPVGTSADINADRSIDLQDLALLLANFGITCN